MWDFDSMFQWLCVCRNGAVWLASLLTLPWIVWNALLLPLAFAFESGAGAQCGAMVQLVDAQ